MDEAITKFSDFTGASPSVAVYYLEACNGDLGTAIHQYLENPTDEGPLDALPQPVRTDVDLTQPDLEEPECIPSPQVSPVNSFVMGRHDGLGDDEDLQKALEESLRAHGGQQPEVQDVAGDSQGAGGSSAPSGNQHPQFDDVTDTPNLIVEGHAISPSRIQSPPPDDVDMGGPSESPRFPSDVNLVEAEMLETAFFGVPYNARMSEYVPPRSPSPDTIARRKIIDNQEKEYNESLQADMEKAEVAARASREAEEMARYKREQEVAETRRKEEDQAALEQLIAAKRLSLPPEPSDSAPDTVRIMIRLPDGTKLSRRFNQCNPMQILFDYVDVELGGKDSDLMPGKYNLLRHYPKVVFEPGQDEISIKSQGLSDEVLLAMKRD